jgi:hypothetical protein
VWGTGNPFISVHVDDFRVGYEKRLCEAGYRTQSAYPWKESDYTLVQAHLDQRVRETKGVERMLAARDSLILGLGWLLYSRGETAVKWRLSQIRTLTGGRLLLPFIPVMSHLLRPSVSHPS